MLKKIGRGLKKAGKAVGGYTMNVLVGIDQLGNTILAGEPDETISARAGRNASKRGWRVLAAGLNKIDPNHVEDAIESERRGKQQDEFYSDVYDQTCEVKETISETKEINVRIK